MDKKVLRGELQPRIYPSGDDAHILDKLVNYLQRDHAIGRVLLYKPLKKWHEVDVTSLPVRLPDIHFDTLDDTKDAPFPTKKYDAVIVPLFGFNEHGYRLGHGGGWYDRFLVMQPQALKIGVGYENSKVSFEPDPHDVRLDVILTEKTSRYFR